MKKLTKKNMVRMEMIMKIWKMKVRHKMMRVRSRTISLPRNFQKRKGSKVNRMIVRMKEMQRTSTKH